MLIKNNILEMSVCYSGREVLSMSKVAGSSPKKHQNMLAYVNSITNNSLG